MKVDFNINYHLYKRIKYKNNQQTNIQQLIQNNKLNNGINPLNFYSNNLLTFKGNEIQLKNFRKSTTKPQEDKLTEMLTSQEGKEIPSLILLYSEDNQKSAELLGNVGRKTNSRIVELEKSISVEDLKSKLIKISPKLRYVNNCNLKTIKTIGFCAGSGSEFIGDTDAFVTGDIKFHTATDSKKVIFDIGHFESEIFSVELLKNITKVGDKGIIANEKSPFI